MDIEKMSDPREIALDELRITVYGSSSSKTPEKFVKAAFELGQLLARRGLTCVNGGGMSGVMGGMNRGCRSAGGNIIGVIHEQFCVDGDEDRLITNMIVCKGDDLEERKQLLLDNGDCILVMPGGVGTFDELWDAVCSKSLGFSGLEYKPICVVNVEGFFDGSIAQIKKAFDENLLYLPLHQYFHVAATPEEGVDWCVREVKRIHPSSVDHVHDSLEVRHELRKKERKETLEKITKKPHPEEIPSNTISPEILHNTHFTIDVPNDQNHNHHNGRNNSPCCSPQTMQNVVIGVVLGLFLSAVLERQ